MWREGEGDVEVVRASERGSSDAVRARAWCVRVVIVIVIVRSLMPVGSRVSAGRGIPVN